MSVKKIVKKYWGSLELKDKQLEIITQFIDNKDGSIKIYNTNNKYLGYNKTKDEVELVDNNNKNDVSEHFLCFFERDI